MKKILIVEDSSTVTKILKHLVKQHAGIQAFFAGSFAESKQLYQQHKEDIFAAIVDLNLPDAPNGETVDFFLAEKLPVIVLTANYQDEKREELLNKGIVDYVIKESRYSYNHALALVRRLDKNQHIKILVAEDSKPTRNFIKSLLRQHLYQVLEATNGVEALEILNNHPDIKLLITDYHMPEMDGFELVKTIRHNVDKANLVIIGLSGEGQGSLSAKFIKNGANDFLKKPFFHEELHCRVMHNIEELELIETIQESANRDYLTGQYNRRYFFEAGEQLYAHAKKADSTLALATLRVDQFTQLCEEYGNQAGDQILHALAQELSHTFSRFLLARIRGDNFGILIPGLQNEQAITLLDKLRAIIASISIETDEEELHITVSIGVTNHKQQSLNQQLHYAGQLLQHAIDAGGNIVIGDEE